QARRFLARHGRRQSSRRPPDDEAYRRRTRTAALHYTPWLRSQNRCLADRRRSDRPGYRHYLRRAHIGSGCRKLMAEAPIQAIVCTMRWPLFIACPEVTRYKVAGARKPFGGTKGL